MRIEIQPEADTQANHGNDNQHSDDIAPDVGAGKFRQYLLSHCVCFSLLFDLQAKVNKKTERSKETYILLSVFSFLSFPQTFATHQPAAAEHPVLPPSGPVRIQKERKEASCPCHSFRSFLFSVPETITFRGARQIQLTSCGPLHDVQQAHDGRSWWPFSHENRACSHVFCCAAEMFFSSYYLIFYLLLFCF